MLAEFGHLALTSLDLDGILNQACTLVARGLDAPLAKVLEARPDGQGLLLRAAVGLPPDLATVGHTTIPAGERSAAGYALKTGEPVICRVPTETRFEVSEIVRRSSVRVSANVLIQGENPAFGTLEVDRVDDRDFTQDDIHFLQSYANLLAAAVERQRASVLLETLAREREVLMQELQHRIKNDLQLVTAFLSLESRQAGSMEARARLDRVRARVEALRLLHERLLVSGHGDRAELGGYLRELCLGRTRTHDLEPNDGIKLDLDLAEIDIDRDRAVAIGLIVNEFLTNSFKYAFPMGTGVIRIVLKRSDPDHARLTLSDNGIGLPSNPQQAEGGMGMRLIGMLVQQIGAEADWAGGPGTRLAIGFPLRRP